MADPGLFDHGRSQVDAHAAGRGQCRQQISRSAAQFDHPQPRRHLKTERFLKMPMTVPTEQASLRMGARNPAPMGRLLLSKCTVDWVGDHGRNDDESTGTVQVETTLRRS